MVLRCIDDYLEGTRYPLDVVKHVFKDSSAAVSGDLRLRVLDHPAVNRLL